MFLNCIFLFVILSYLIIILWLIKRHFREKKNNINTNKNIIATITHDLKTPAVAQIRALELLLKGNFGEINDSQRSFLNDILSSCNTMLDMLLNMLWLYKFDNHKVAINLISFCVNDVIQDVFRENKLLLSSKNQKFKFNYTTAKTYIIADKMHVKRVISNLLINAVNYSKEQSEISIETSITNGKFYFLIKNKSVYMTDEMLKCLNDRESVFNQKTHALSTGLGLYLTNSLLRLNGGEFIHSTTSDDLQVFGFSIDLNNKKSVEKFYKNIAQTLIGK